MPTSRLPPAKDQQVIVDCDSAAITAGDISGVLSALKSLSSDRSSAMSAEGVVTLVFHGYDDDPRELESIPEVRAWFAHLFANSGPNWTHIPRQTGQPFQSKLDTDSTANWTVK